MKLRELLGITDTLDIRLHTSSTIIVHPTFAQMSEHQDDLVVRIYDEDDFLNIQVIQE